jgi:hypothetical protein
MWTKLDKIQVHVYVHYETKEKSVEIAQFEGSCR